MFTDSEKKAILASWRLVVPVADTVADLVYKRLFELRPDYRRLFPSEMSSQKRKLIKMLAFIVKSLDFREEQWREDVAPNEDLMLVVLALGRRHRMLYKIPEESYAFVGDALISTLEHELGQAFTPQMKGAWVRLYAYLSTAMRMGGAVMDPYSDIVSAEESQRYGSVALMSQQAEVGIDEERLALSEEPS